MQKGTFISIEGGEGAGKTTIINLIEKYIEDRGFEVLTTREPGGIEIAEKIRAIILDRNHVNMDSRTEALLYAAARRQHLVEKVIPALKDGKVVISDRFVDSSLVYQGYARELGIEAVYAINQFAIEGCLPDLTIYLDISPEVGFIRINANKNREINRLDLEDLSFHHKVREGYLLLLEQFPERIKRIDANGTQEQVYLQVEKVLAEYFLGKPSS